jgi:YegS/Rv2252/BmrU family lipid kinase
MRALLVVNPRSRRGRELGERVRRELTDRGIEIVGRSQSLRDVDGIVAAGGDGTLVRLIPLAIGLDVPIGLVPLGTFNDLARTLAIPLDVGEACNVIAAGRTRAIDVARVNGVYYVNEASIGISSRLARLQTRLEKQRLGLLTVVASALQAFRHAAPIRAEVAYDGKVLRLRTIQLTVANSNRFGGFLRVDDAAIDDGWLDLYSVEIDSVAQAFSVARAILAGKRRSVPGLRSYRAGAFGVWTRRAHRITADGEPAGRTPARFEIARKALRIFAPSTI